MTKNCTSCIFSPSPHTAAGRNTEKITAYKGFDANLQCRGFQFEVGSTYTHKGKVEACKSGFHAVDGHPLSVFNYYAPAGSRFCIVEIDGIQSRDGDGNKVAAEIMTVIREIGLHDLATEAVKWVMDRATLEGPVAVKDNGLATASGYQGAATASGYLSKVKGAVGNALFSVERETWDGPIVSVACGVVGVNGIEADVWYSAIGGKLVAS